MVRVRYPEIEAARRVVVKVGSNVLTAKSGLNLTSLIAISKQICSLIDDGREVILVSSGAMAAGFKKMGFAARPEAVPARQAVAAVGQASLILAYEQVFAQFGQRVAQILLTGEGLDNRKRYLNARNTLNTLLAWGVVPIINENDTVSIEEIKLGDNDNLSALIALLMDADILINLTDIDGLYTHDPRTHPEARLIETVSAIDPSVEQMAGKIAGALGTGGMGSKVKAAAKATAAGIPMVIANGLGKATLVDLFAGKSLGTYFKPGRRRLNRRKCWIGLTVRSKGTIAIDDGAVEAIRRRGKSLLPGGILGVTGRFDIGEAVTLETADNRIVGQGLVNYSATEIRKIQGLKTAAVAAKLGSKPYDEVIHRDNLVVTMGE